MISGSTAVVDSVVVTELAAGFFFAVFELLVTLTFTGEGAVWLGAIAGSFVTATCAPRCGAAQKAVRMTRGREIQAFSRPPKVWRRSVAE